MILVTCFGLLQFLSITVCFQANHEQINRNPKSRGAGRYGVRVRDIEYIHRHSNSVDDGVEISLAASSRVGEASNVFAFAHEPDALDVPNLGPTSQLLLLKWEAQQRQSHHRGHILGILCIDAI